MCDLIHGWVYMSRIVEVCHFLVYHINGILYYMEVYIFFFYLPFYSYNEYIHKNINFGMLHGDYLPFYLYKVYIHKNISFITLLCFMDTYNSIKLYGEGGIFFLIICRFLYISLNTGI